MAKKTKFEKLEDIFTEKEQYVEDRLEEMEKLLDKLGPLLTDAVVANYLDTLSIENGVILNNLQNLRKTALLDRIHNDFMVKEGYQVVSVMVDDMYKLSGLNLDYFSELEGRMVDNRDIENIINERLGLTPSGVLKKDGFMKGVLDNTSVRDEIKKFTVEKVTGGGAGYQDLKKGLKELIEGNPEKMGKFKQFYNNVAYDTYTNVDALNAKLYADKLDLKYFIYGGTKVRDSRHFCIQRKGKIFSTEEANRDWPKLIGTTTTMNGKVVPAGPIVAGPDIATYNPVINMGGYRCRDHAMYISYEIAVSRRPDLKID